MENNIKRIWCECCDDGDNENCDIRAVCDEPFIHINFNSDLIVTYSNGEKDFEVGKSLTLSDIKFFLDNYSKDSWCSNLLGDCYNIGDEAFINIEFEDGKIFLDDIHGALCYLISTNTETERI